MEKTNKKEIKYWTNTIKLVSLIISLLLIIIFLNSCNNRNKESVLIKELIDTTKLSHLSADSLYKMSLQYFFLMEDTLNGKLLFNYALRKGCSDAILDNALTIIEKGNKSKGIEMIMNLYNKKVPRAYYELGLIYLKTNKNRGLCLLDSAVVLGTKGLAFLMSGLYFSGQSDMIHDDLTVTIDSAKAIWYLRKAAIEEDRLGQYNLAAFYLELKAYDSASKYFHLCIQNNTELDEDEIDMKDLCKEQLVMIDSILKLNKHN